MQILLSRGTITEARRNYSPGSEGLDACFTGKGALGSTDCDELEYRLSCFAFLYDSADKMGSIGYNYCCWLSKACWTCSKTIRSRHYLNRSIICSMGLPRKQFRDTGTYLTIRWQV